AFAHSIYATRCGSPGGPIHSVSRFSHLWRSVATGSGTVTGTSGANFFGFFIDLKLSMKVLIRPTRRVPARMLRPDRAPAFLAFVLLKPGKRQVGNGKPNRPVAAFVRTRTDNHWVSRG